MFFDLYKPEKAVFSKFLLKKKIIFNELKQTAKHKTDISMKKFSSTATYRIKSIMKKI